MIIEHCLCIRIHFKSEFVVIGNIREIESYCRNNNIQFDYYRSTIEIFESDINKEELNYEDCRVNEICIYLKEEMFSIVDTDIKNMLDRILKLSEKNKKNEIPF